MDAARFDLGEVCKQGGQQLVGPTHQLACGGQEVVVREMLETEDGLGAFASDEGAHTQQHTPRNFELLCSTDTRDHGAV